MLPTLVSLDPASMAERLLSDAYARAVDRYAALLNAKAFVRYVFMRAGKTVKLDAATLDELIADNGSKLETAERGALIVLLKDDGSVISFGIAVSADEYIFFNEGCGKVETASLTGQSFAAIRVK